LFSIIPLFKNNESLPQKKSKSKITIGLLFSEGKSVSKYPYASVYHCGPSTDNQKKWEFLFPRETLKKQWTGTTLNVLRETYRLNKHILINNMDAPCFFMFFYQTKDRLSYEEINTKTIQLFENL
jgi:ribonuclease P protein component